MALIQQAKRWDENWLDGTAQFFFVVRVPFLEPCKRKEQLNFGTWCFGVFTSNAFVNFMITIATEDYKHSVGLVLAVVRRTKHSELCTSHQGPRKWGALIRK